jgi:bacterioferritin (cytochrome b1)
MSKRTDLVSQLNALLRLTHTEIMVAETRRAQAATRDIERELDANADKARQRSQLLTDAIRDLGGVPDVLGVAAGRVAATAKATAEQGQDLVEALLGDLALEHQLLDRARLAWMLADVADETATKRTLERLETAHTATIDWLMTRLGEVAVGGPAALRPTPMQTAVGLGRRVGSLPARNVAVVANRSIDLAERVRRDTADGIRSNAARVRQLVDSAAEIWSAGRDASLKRSEELARERGARGTVRTVNRTRRDLGAVDAAELPIRRYDSLTVDAAVAAINRLRDPDDVRTVLAYETAHKGRKGVADVARAKLEELAASLAEAS